MDNFTKMLIGVISGIVILAVGLFTFTTIRNEYTSETLASTTTDTLLEQTATMAVSYTEQNGTVILTQTVTEPLNIGSQTSTEAPVSTTVYFIDEQSTTVIDGRPAIVETVIVTETTTQIPETQVTNTVTQVIQQTTVPTTAKEIQTDINGKININTADKDSLMDLPGIGEAKSQAIIDYRNENGAFNTIEDITNVSGIGEKTFEKIKDRISA